MMTTLRRISIDTLTPATLADQPAPILDWIALDRMVIDDRYQRPLTKQSRAVIQKIAANFRWSRFGPVLVAPTVDGMYSLIDGQHRAHAAALCGITRVPAMAIQIDMAEQARAFAQINTSTIRVTPQQAYRAALAAGDATAVSAQAWVAKAGCKLMENNNTMASDKRPGEIYAIQLILQLVRAGHGPILCECLAGLVAYDTTGRVALYSDFILRPLLMAGATLPGITAQDVTTALRSIDPFRLIDRMQKTAADTGQQGGKVTREGFVQLLAQTIATRRAAP